MLGKLWAFWLLIGSLFAALGVLGAAAGSHIFKSSLNEETMRWFTSANQMHLYHSMALLIVALISQRVDSNLVHISGAFFLIGMFLFPAVLYLAAIKDARHLLFLAPYGGMSFTIGWLILTVTGGLILFKS